MRRSMPNTPITQLMFVCAVALAPVVVVFGQATAPATRPMGPARWEKEIAAFEAKDRQNPPPRGAVLFTGASSIRMWTTLAQDFPNHAVLNRGFGGSQIEDATYFA